jgi:Ni/Co efflux regulator RcnB
MKRLILILAAATSLATGLAAADIALAGEGGGHGRWAERGGDRGGDRGGGDRGGPPGQARRYEQGRAPMEFPGGGGRGRWADAPRGRYDEAPRGRYDDGPRLRYEDAPRGRYEEAPRGRNDGRYDGRYDEAPPSFVRRGFSPRPGGYLPPDYRGAPVGDYQRYRLRPPPRGYSWIHVGKGFALVGPDGQVFDVIQ